MELLLDSCGVKCSDLGVCLGNLVGIHARSRDLDRTSPVEVVVAHVKTELLEGISRQWRIVEGHIEVSGQSTALSCLLRHQVKVKTLLIILIFDHQSVNTSA